MISEHGLLSAVELEVELDTEPLSSWPDAVESPGVMEETCVTCPVAEEGLPVPVVDERDEGDGVDDESVTSVAESCVAVVIVLRPVGLLEAGVEALVLSSTFAMDAVVVDSVAVLVDDSAVMVVDAVGSVASFVVVTFEAVVLSAPDVAGSMVVVKVAFGEAVLLEVIMHSGPVAETCTIGETSIV